MKENITKNSLNQSIELISELNLNEEDYEKIFDKFKLILENREIKDTIENVSNIPGLRNENDLKVIMKKLSSDLDLSDFNKLLKDIIKNEELIDFIQDLFLEKLI